MRGRSLGSQEADFRVVVVEESVDGLVDGEVGFREGRRGTEGVLEGFGRGVARVEGLD